MKSSTLEFLKTECAFDKAALKWISEAGDILKYIDQEVILVSFKRDSKESPWQTKNQSVKIDSIGDFDPLTGTYAISYMIDNEGKTERIIPQGFSFNSPDIDNWMHRFVPFSLHFKITEEEAYYERLKKIYPSKITLPVDILKQFVENKKALTDYNHVITCVNTDVDGGLGIGMVSIRLSAVTGINNYGGNECGFTLKDSYGNFFPVRWKQSESEIKFKVDGKFVGMAKIFDLED